MSDQITHFVKATILLGDISLDCFQLPNGNYRYTYEFLSSLIDRDKTILSNKKSPYALQNILGKDKTSWNTKIEGINKAYKYNTISSESLMLVLGAFANLGQHKVIALLVACGMETLERRADAAFGVQQSEQERNQRLVFRRDGIISRHFWTDTIDTYINNNQVSDNYKRFIYLNVSDLINKAILGCTAAQYRESLGLSNGNSTRDYLTTDQLKQIDTIEKAAGMRVDKNNVCPKQAVKDVIGLIC